MEIGKELLESLFFGCFCPSVFVAEASLKYTCNSNVSSCLQKINVEKALIYLLIVFFQ